MLRFLRIRNLAVIETAEVEFGPGLNVLTGETGAGKSMLVDAVGLLLGSRATADLVRTGETQATIEALFETPTGGELVVRREITSQGRSRAFLDGDLATVAAVRDAAAGLVELHGQHEHQALLDPQTHLAVLDQSIQVGDLTKDTAAAWAAFHALRERLRARRMDQRERAARLELVDFQLAEIDRVSPKAGEDAALEQERRVLAGAERVRELCETAYAALYDDEQAVLSALATVWRRTEELAGFDPSFAPFLEARDGMKAQLEELARARRARADALDASPGRLEEVTDRLVALDGLKRKHGPTLADVLARAEALREEQRLLGGAGETTEALEARTAEAEQRFLAAAGRLSEARRAGAVTFAADLEALLRGLAMQARFEVRFTDLPAEAWSASGTDAVEFYLSPNPGEDLRPLARVASGGELSRIMLALKTRAAAGSGAAAAPRTLVFDEVDAGIGGRVAGVVGGHLRALGEGSQVLCITHLPQIAAAGSVHFQIAKAVRGARTVTSVTRLDPEGRVEEIARMIGGAAVTDAVRASARELLAGGESRKAKAKVRPGAKGESR